MMQTFARLFLFLFLPSFGFSTVAYSADNLTIVGSPAQVQVTNFTHIYWQKMTYQQGDCPVPLEAIAYWSPNHVTASQGDSSYTPVVSFHGGGWSGSAQFSPPDTAAKAEGIDTWVKRGVLLILPTYRGHKQVELDPSIATNCEHSQEMAMDAQYLVEAVVNRNSQIPMASSIRSGDKIRLQGGSAGAHVAMRLAVNQPDWFDRVYGLIGIYDLQEWRQNWTANWNTFGDRNLDECVEEYGNKVVATTFPLVCQTAPSSIYEISNRNCARVPQLMQPRKYRITDPNDASKWAEVNNGVFLEQAKSTAEACGGADTVTKFFDYSLAFTGIPDASSEPGGVMPNFGNSIKIVEVDPVGAPVKTYTDARSDFVDPQKDLAKTFLDYLFAADFLAFSPNDPLLLENSFGEVVKTGTGNYPPFRIVTNTGDFVLNEQALSFCNDIQDSEGLPDDEIITETAKGVIYQCGDKGTLFITVGGTHLSGYSPMAQLEADSNFDWFLGNADPYHSNKPFNCTYQQNPLTTWAGSTNGSGAYLSLLNGILLGSSSFNGSIFDNEWDAIQNDPYYFGPGVDSIPFVLSLWGTTAEYIIKPGNYATQGPYGPFLESCIRAL